MTPLCCTWLALAWGSGVQLAGKLGEEDEEELLDDRYLGEEATYLTSEETALLTCDDIVFDTGATVSFFKNSKLLTSIGTSTREIHVKGVQADAKGVTVSEEGTFIDRGRVHFNAKGIGEHLVDVGAH